MKREVEIALRLLLKFDSSIPPDGRIDHAFEILKGHDRRQSPIVRLPELRRIFGVSKRTLEHLMNSGRLDRIVGKGDRTMGVTRESLKRFMRGESEGTAALVDKEIDLCRSHDAIDKSVTASELDFSKRCKGVRRDGSRSVRP